MRKTSAIGAIETRAPSTSPAANWRPAELTPQSYRDAIDGLITAARAEPRVAPVVAAWNEPRLRLMPS